MIFYKSLISNYVYSAWRNQAWALTSTTVNRPSMGVACRLTTNLTIDWLILGPYVGSAHSVISLNGPHLGQWLECWWCGDTFCYCTFTRWFNVRSTVGWFPGHRLNLRCSVTKHLLKSFFSSLSFPLPYIRRPLFLIIFFITTLSSSSSLLVMRESSTGRGVLRV